MSKFAKVAFNTIDLIVIVMMAFVSPIGTLVALASAPPSIENLWQCDPPDVFDPSTYTCVSSGSTGWSTGNNNGPFFEGQTVPYRTHIQNLVSSNEYSITIQWDTTKSSKHAFDYLETYNATIKAADPCASLTGLPAGLCSSSTTWPIPADGFMQSQTAWIANSGVQDAGNFTMFGGEITGVSGYTDPASYTSDTSTSITIFFTANSTDIVLAWGGHIAERKDWGQNSSAVSISGSPYHMRILSWYDITNTTSLNVGNTDRSLSAQAVIYPASITIIKDAVPNGSTSFPFTASPSPLGNFSLIDNGTLANTTVFSNITDFQTYTVTENTPSGWSFTGANCSVLSPNGGSQSISGATATIVLKEGENVTCTYTNTRDQGSIELKKAWVGTGGQTTLNIGNSAGGAQVDTQLTGAAGAAPLTTGANIVDTGTYYVSETGGLTNYDSSDAVCVDTGNSNAPVSVTAGGLSVGKGMVVVCTFTNTRQQGYLKISKVFNALTSGFAGTFPIVYNCGGSDVTVNLAAGGSTTVGPFDTGTTCTVTEPSLPTAPTGWTFGTPTFSSPNPVTIVKGDQAAAVEVTVTNSITRDVGTLKITKTTSNPDGATLPAAFTGTYDCGVGYTGNFSVANGASQTITGIPTGNTCSVVETAPIPITGYTWGTITYTPTSIVISDKGGTFEIVVGNSITRDLGNLKITKTTSNPDGATLPTAFTGIYDCGGIYTGNFSVANGASQTITGIPTGSTCTVSEIAPTPITGYTWGTITYTPASIVISDKGGTFEIVVGNSITRDLGNFKITKTTSNPDGATLPAAFTGTYDCGVGYTGNFSVANGASQTISGIPTGNTCSVVETAPIPITGYTWGTITYTPTSIVISDKGGTFEIVVGNSITRDLGNLKITKTTSNPDGATLPTAFTGTYDCGVGYTGNFSVANGASQTITGIPTGNTCSVVETAPTPITGYTWGTITYTPASIVISDKGGSFEIVVGNSITRDLGNLKITKTTSNPDGATLPAAFTGTYDCGGSYTGNFSVASGASQTIGGIPTGNTCSVVETAPTPITGYTWGTITYTPASIVISDKGGTFEIVVSNSITRDLGSLKITKTVTGAPVDFTGSFDVHVVCTGDGGTYDRTINYPDPGFVTITGIPTGNTCTVTEKTKATPPDPYTWGTAVITPTPSGTINKIAPVEVVVANILNGKAKVIKTQSGLTVSGSQAFTFELWKGLLGPDSDTLLESQIANAGNGGTITFVTDLLPGQHYQMCEIVDVGWMTTLGPNPFQLTINGVNDHICTDFVAVAGSTTTFTVDNTPPPGGGARTIGYWKNHSSCKTSKGNQTPILDQTLASFPIASGQSTHGFYVGTLYVDTCKEAYALLDKTTLNLKKVASDPEWNFASQYTAYLLNIQAGAAPNTYAALAAANGQAILIAVGFDGINPKHLTTAQAAALNTYAGILDSYNNNTLP